jgi:hypothetical protein
VYEGNHQEQEWGMSARTADQLRIIAIIATTIAGAIAVGIGPNLWGAL